MPTLYYRRRELTAREERSALGAALGAAVGVGLAVLYVTRVMLQRTPLVEPAAGEGTEPAIPPRRPAPVRAPAAPR